MSTDKELHDAFDGWWIYDCAIRKRDIFSFLLLEQKEDSANGLKKMVNYLPNELVGEKIGWVEFDGFQIPRIEVSQLPVNQAIMVSLDCCVAALGAGMDDMEKAISMGKNGCLITSCHGLKNIGGMIYATGGWRSVCRRIGPDRWESIVDRASMPEPARLDYGGTDGGFDALDGFNQQDIYCAGGAGDVWRFDGKRWHQCAVPTNQELSSVCCAGDGYVYIGMQMGSVMRGRENKWEIIHKGDMSLRFKDMVWYQGKVWCTSDYGLWVIENGKLREANEFGPEVYARSGNLAVGDGVMLLAGMQGATVYDGKSWSTIL